MVKKLALAWVTVLMVVCITLTAFAYQPAVVDEQNLFTSSQKDTLIKLVDTLRTKYQIDAVVLTTDRTPTTSEVSRIVDWADRYYEDMGYGLGEDRAGFVYLIDMNNRFSYISTAGVMIDYLNDSRIETCLSAADPYLHSGNYGRAAEALLRQVMEYMAEGIEEGTFRYDSVTGERLSGLYNKLTKNEFLVALVAGLACVAVMVLSVVATYSLRGSTYHYDLENNASLRLSRNDQTYIRQTVSRVRHDTSSGGGSHGGSSGGSGVHVSSGGMSHGGGGHHF